MALKYFDRVKETTTTTGTGNITCAGAVAGFIAFSTKLAVGDMFTYGLVSGTAWETGIGTMISTGVFSRTLVDSSTGSLINLSGTSDIFLTPIAQQFHSDLGKHYGTIYRMNA